MKISDLLCCVPLCFISATAQAVDLGHGFTFKAFGTGGFASSSTGNADFIANYVFQPAGAGNTNGVSMVVDSKLGMQLDYQATDRLNFVVQGLSKQQHDKSFSPVLEWAFAKFKLMPELNIRAGRIRPAVYMLSDYLDVNYANPWVRPPVEFYSSASLSRMEGVDLLWRPTTGDVSWLVQPYYGITELGLPGKGNSSKADNILGINLSGTYGDLTLRAGFATGELSLSFPGSAQATNALLSICNSGLDPVACSQYDRYSFIRQRVNFGSVGVNWDNPDYFIMGEFGKRTSDSKAIGNSTSWYISGGTHIDKFTPYITFANYHNDSGATDYSDANNVFNLGLGATVNRITSAILQGNAMDQNTITLGIRYDFMSNFALKAQWDHIQTSTKGGLPGTGKGLFVNRVADFGNGPTQVDLFSVTLDFVF
jgi:hypothetical protein